MTTPGHSIRTAELSDARGVARVQVTSRQAAYPGLIDQAFLDALDVDDRTDSWYRILRQPRGSVLVADENAAVVAGNLSGGNGRVAYRVNGSAQRTDDYRTPRGDVPNSQSNSKSRGGSL